MQNLHTPVLSFIAVFIKPLTDFSTRNQIIPPYRISLRCFFLLISHLLPRFWLFSQNIVMRATCLRSPLRSGKLNFLPAQNIDIIIIIPLGSQTQIRGRVGKWVPQGHSYNIILSPKNDNLIGRTSGTGLRTLQTKLCPFGHRTALLRKECLK